MTNHALARCRLIGERLVNACLASLSNERGPFAEFVDDEDGGDEFEVEPLDRSVQNNKRA